MIKIIQQGTRHKKECEDCGCIFSYDQEDVEIDGVKLSQPLYIVCPQCGKNIYIQAERGLNINEIPIN